VIEHEHSAGSVTDELEAHDGGIASGIPVELEEALRFARPDTTRDSVLADAERGALLEGDVTVRI
jgi:hypothetical protein